MQQDGVGRSIAANHTEYDVATNSKAFTEQNDHSAAARSGCGLIRSSDLSDRMGSLLHSATYVRPFGKVELVDSSAKSSIASIVVDAPTGRVFV